VTTPPSREPPPLDAGQVGEIRPMKRKPMALTVLILVGAYIGRRLLLVQLLTLMPWLNPKALVPILVGSSLTVASCFFKVLGLGLGLGLVRVSVRVLASCFFKVCWWGLGLALGVALGCSPRASSRRVLYTWCGVGVVWCRAGMV